MVGRVEADVPKPAADYGDIDACRDEVDRGGVTEAMWRHMLRLQAGYDPGGPLNIIGQ
jgi:hypothetical protein